MRILSISLIALVITGCSSYRDIPANSSEQLVLQKMGTPTATCSRPDGSRRLIWSTQPNGQYAYGSNISKDGVADKVSSLLTEANFKKLDTGTWTPQDVQCEFGPPAEIGRVGLGEKNEVVWTYRYRELNVWNNLMFVYFGKDGSKVTHYHSGPDPRYDPDTPWLFRD